MTTDSTSPDTRPLSNVPEMTVSELSFSLKRTLEDTYGRVRIRGELSRVTIPASGHLYTDLKDDKAVINAICWKGVLSKLSIKPEEGLEVICTGRVSTYPARSNYQLIIETMELAGEGALLKMLEDRRKKLAAEGLFAEDRKKPLPYLPDVIGVVTSPTGAVIRDIMHRLSDRFPRHVLVWPARVQGEQAAEEVAAGIRGFAALTPGGKIPRPDVIIVARGGGSLEDLMPFNEEVVVRAAAECDIPIISAVGHETDTTLIDYVSDKRAPTPTGAAEIAVPRRSDLMTSLQERQLRLGGAMNRITKERADRLEAYGGRLAHPERLLETRTQRLDNLGDKLSGLYDRYLTVHKGRVTELSARLTHPRALLDGKKRDWWHTAKTLDGAYKNILSRKASAVAERAARLATPDRIIKDAALQLEYQGKHLRAVGGRLLTDHEKHLSHAARMLESLSFKNVLNRGFVLVRDAEGIPVTQANDLSSGQTVSLQFRDDQHVSATITGDSPPKKAPKPAKTPKKSAKKPENTTQGKLF